MNRWDRAALVACAVAVGITAFVILNAWFAPAHAAHRADVPVWTEPYGGCKEAYMAPHSAGAAECRAHGWTVRARLIVNPNRHLTMTTLPRCREEDGSGQASACTWNLGRPRSWGRTYWVDAHERVHYLRWW